MTIRQAKDILMLYRPGTADVDDPAFAEALSFCDGNHELNNWFRAHCETYTALRARFKEISVPEGFKEQILAERKVHTETFWRSRLVVPAVATVAILAVIFGSFLWIRAERENSLVAFRNWGVSTGLLNYRMNLETNDLNEIQDFLAKKNFHADYQLPPNLQSKAQATGCALLRWQGQRVSMICFRSGKPLGPGETSDLFLFVTDNPDLSTSGETGKVALSRASRATTASWKQNGKTYLLVAAGDEDFLREFL